MINQDLPKEVDKLVHSTIDNLECILLNPQTYHKNYMLKVYKDVREGIDNLKTVYNMCVYDERLQDLFDTYLG